MNSFESHSWQRNSWKSEWPKDSLKDFVGTRTDFPFYNAKLWLNLASPQEAVAGFADTPIPVAGQQEKQRSAKLQRLEAVLFVAENALSARRIAQFATLADAKEARALIDELNTLLDSDQSTFRVERVSTGYRLMTLPRFAFWLDKLHRRSAQLKLSPPAMETLSIVAYRQPLTRADVETIRGVAAAEMLKQLMERGLVRIVGEHDSLGRPYLYGTTSRFLETFGLKNLDDLPNVEQLRAKPQLLEQEEPTDETEDEETGNDEDEDSELDDDELDDEEEDDEYDEEDEEEDEEDFDEDNETPLREAG